MRILVPVDGSEESRRLIRFLGTRETLLGASPEIELLNVQTGPSEGLSRVFGLEAVNAVYQEEGRKVFDALREDIEAAGIAPKEVVKIGEAGAGVAKEAEASGADLIVMGSRGLNPIRGFFLGSFTNAVLSQVKTPVLILREGSVVPPKAMRVGVAIDGSAYGEAAVNYVLANRELFGDDATFEILHVAEGPSTLLNVAPEMDGAVSVTGIQRTIADELNDEVFAPVEKIFADADVPVKKVSMVGTAADQIAKYAADNLDMIVMGSHGRGNFSAAVLGSVAMKVAANTTQPVLVIRK